MVKGRAEMEGKMCILTAYCTSLSLLCFTNEGEENYGRTLVICGKIKGKKKRWGKKIVKEVDLGNHSHN